MPLSGHTTLGTTNGAPYDTGLTSIGTPIITMNGAPPPDTGPSFSESVTEAEARPLDFHATERATYIRDLVAQIQAKQATGAGPQELKAQFAEFNRAYPRLFETLMEPGYDKQTLQTMLAMLDRMGQGSLTQHQASVIVGQRLLEKAKAKK